MPPPLNETLPGTIMYTCCLKFIIELCDTIDTTITIDTLLGIDTISLGIDSIAYT